MKFVHIADVHFDMPFTMLSSRNNMGDKRRLEQRWAFDKVINYIKDNSIEYFFISGDLYENNHVRSGTIEYINNCFKQIPNTKIYISPGNHDPYLKNSVYNMFGWNDNVTIFNKELGKFEDNNINIYGLGFSDFTLEDSELKNIVIEDKNKINILVVHASVDSSVFSEKLYNPITSNKLKEIGFDYIALGHIHKRNYISENIIYPGSLVSLGFDEPGEHGMIVGEITKEELKTKFIAIDDRFFETMEVDVSNFNSQEDLISYLNTIYKLRTMFKVVLTGRRNFEIFIGKILDFIGNENILKIEDKTTLPYDLEALKCQNSLKGIFVKNMLQKLKENPEKEEEIKKAIEICLSVL